jgi:adenylate cyclase
VTSQETAPEEQSRKRRERLDRLRDASARAGEAARRADHNPRWQGAVQRLRAALPGDAHFGDPLSLGGSRHTEVAGRTVVELTGNRPGVIREFGLGGLQVWQAFREKLGAGSGDHEVTLAFLDLAGFSSWALSAGDDEVLRVLREVSDAWEPPITVGAGTVVKRLGDGLMAAFAVPEHAVDAVLDGRDRLASVRVDGFVPRMRAGLHLGRPRRVGGDYLGVSVNVAARIGERAKANEILVSGDVLAQLDNDRFQARRRHYLSKPKGAPDDLAIYQIERA